jgi:hypothetical protein
MRVGFRFLSSTALLSCAVAVSACASQPGPKRTHIKIESDPPGASVRLTGRLVGVTPISLEIAKEFPQHWTSKIETDEEGFAFYRQLEYVEISKDGCEPVVKRVMKDELKSDLSVTLKCEPAANAPTAKSAPASLGTVEERLKKLDGLREKGLITEDEHREQRQRILNSL